jgi:hypothetical protein
VYGRAARRYLERRMAYWKRSPARETVRPGRIFVVVAEWGESKPCAW